MLAPLSALLGLFAKDLGIDLGTANTLVYVRERGVVISEPSVVATDKRSGKVLAVGAEAKKMVGRTPANIVAVRPLKDGVIADFETVESMLHYFIRKVHDQYPFTPRPRVIIGVPSGVTEVEKRAVQDAALNAGSREAYMIEEPMAAAIGAGLPIHEAAGSMIVDVGGGTTEVAVISLGGVVLSRSIRIGGDEIDEQIVQFARREHDLYIGERTAEETKIAIGSASMVNEELKTTMRGRDLVTGLPKEVDVTIGDIRDAISGPVNLIVEAVTLSIEETPPELLADIMDQGIILAGGGALLKGLDVRLEEETKMPVHIADDPLQCVVRGTGMCLENIEVYRKVFVTDSYARLRT
ncbi:MAG TPA: rod shape-determining protein [Chloroflexota bacterium]|jgi:rod shape-determining protein MreB and related proteins|nr:rod shape-determining protein [Chloroflexota bacterium]